MCVWGGGEGGIISHGVCGCGWEGASLVTVGVGAIIIHRSIGPVSENWRQVKSSSLSSTVRPRPAPPVVLPVSPPPVVLGWQAPTDLRVLAEPVLSNQ